MNKNVEECFTGDYVVTLSHVHSSAEWAFISKLQLKAGTFVYFVFLEMMSSAEKNRKSFISILPPNVGTLIFYINLKHYRSWNETGGQNLTS